MAGGMLGKNYKTALEKTEKKGGETKVQHLEGASGQVCEGRRTGKVESWHNDEPSFRHPSSSFSLAKICMARI